MKHVSIFEDVIIYDKIENDWEKKNPLPRWGTEPAPTARHSAALPTELIPWL